MVNHCQPGYPAFGREGIEFGRIETVWVRGRAEPVEAVEITGIDAEATSTSHGLIDLATDIRNALKAEFRKLPGGQ